MPDCIRRCGRTAEGLLCAPCLAEGEARLAGDSGRNGVPREKVTRLAPAELLAKPLTEDDVEQAIITWLRLRGWQVTKTSAKRHAKGVTAGTPDLYARQPATQRRAWIEVKGPGGVVSEAQLRWHEEERSAGGTVIVAYSVADVEAVLA